MKKLLIWIVLIASTSSYSAEHIYCGVSGSELAHSKSLNLTPNVELGYYYSGEHSFEFKNVTDKFSTESTTIKTSSLSKREIFLSVRINHDNQDQQRSVEYKIHQRVGKNYLELGRTRYHLGYKALSLDSIGFENMQFGINLPGTNEQLRFACRKLE
jgi:hypothetical protein